MYIKFFTYRLPKEQFAMKFLTILRKLKPDIILDVIRCENDISSVEYEKSLAWNMFP